MYGSTEGRSVAADATLDKYLNQLGSQNDNEALRDNIHKLEMDANETVHAAAQGLKDLTDIARRGDIAQKVQVDRLRSDFEQAARRYTSLQKQVAVKVKYAARTVPSSTETNPFADDPDPFQLEQRQQSRFAAEQDLSQQLAAVQERDQKVRQLETDVLDLNEIMNEIGVLVHEQGNVVNTIEDNIEQAYGAIGDANTNLESAKRHQRSVRKKQCCIAVLVIVVLGVLALVIWLSVRKN